LTRLFLWAVPAAAGGQPQACENRSQKASGEAES